MGRDKATLPFGRHTLLQHIVATLSKIFNPSSIVVVSAVGQSLPTLPSEIVVGHDSVPGRGPLEAMAAGFRELPKSLDAAFVCSCDAPFIIPAVVKYLVRQLGEYDAVMPIDDSGLHPLCGVYHRRVLKHIEQQLACDMLRMQAMIELLSAIRLPAHELRGMDPQLLSLMNLNHPSDYEQALSIFGEMAFKSSE